MFQQFRYKICKRILHSIVPGKYCWNFLVDRRSTTLQFSQKLFHNSTIEPPTSFLEVRDKTTGITREIAFQKSEGPRDLGVVYIPGFMSNKSGIKATSLHRFCQEYGFSYVRYDASGLGESRPISLNDARLTHWIQDAEEILLKVANGPLIIVGSSMGGWISLHLAQKYPEKFSSLILIAPGINFAKRFSDKIIKSLPKSIVQKLENGETIKFSHQDYGTFPVSIALGRDMMQYELDLEKGIEATCPVRILHGIQDEDVPYEESLTIMRSLHSTDVQLTFIKDGDHRLSKDCDLQLLFDTILKLASK